MIIFTPKYISVLQALTTRWQTPKQIAERISQENGNPSDIVQIIKELMSEGLVQANPTVLGLYRLTMNGSAIKDLKLDKMQ